MLDFYDTSVCTLTSTFSLKCYECRWIPEKVYFKASPSGSISPMTSLMYCSDQTITHAAKQSNRQKAISNTYTPQISKRAAVCSAHASSAVLSSLPLWLPVLPTPIMQRKWRRHGDRKLNPNLCVWYNLAIGHAFSSLPPKQDKKDHLCV